jgi:TolB-like protein/Flp pilus assembly protein TadD
METSQETPLTRISADEAGSQMERILASPGFARAERSRRFLRFVVEQALHGRADELKETLVGVEVFRREPDYNPRTDPVVRIEAARLRARLKEYYETQGVKDPTVIVLPKGAYVPVFRPRHLMATTPRRMPVSRLLVIAAACILCLLLVRSAWVYWQPSKVSIAVLPFTDLTPEKDQQYLCDGIAEEITNALSGLDGVRIPGRTSTFQLRQATARQIGDELHVGAVIEGSVRRQGDHLRVTARLIGVSDNSQLWSETWDGADGTALGIEAAVARAVAVKLRVPSGSHPEIKRHTETPEASRLYYEGRYNLDQFTPRAAEAAVALFERAIFISPGFARAHAGLSDAFTELAVLNSLPPGEAWPRAGNAARRAIELDERLAAAHVGLGDVKMTYEWDWAGAEREHRRAIELSPNDPDGHRAFANELLYRARFPQAIAEMQRALTLDPKSARISRELAAIFYHARDYDRAILQCRKTLEIDPEHQRIYHTLARAYAQKQMYTEAIDAVGKWFQPGRTAGMSILGHIYAVSGRQADALRIIEELKRNHQGGFPIAVIYAGLGDRDRAFEQLERAFRDRDYLLTFKVSPEFDPLRGDIRFGQLLKRFGLDQP